MARPASDIAQRLVAAARQRFLNEGVDGASLRQIAKDAGTNIGMVYYYFKTKDDLFLAVVEDVYEGMLSDMTRIFDSGAPDAELFERLYARVAQLSDEEFAVVRLIMREALISSVRLARLGRLFFRGHIPIVLARLQQSAARGQLRTDFPPPLLAAATFLLGIMPQLIRRLLAQTDLPVVAQLPSPEQVAHAMAEVLQHGIATRERAPHKR